MKNKIETIEKEAVLNDLKIVKSISNRYVHIEPRFTFSNAYYIEYDTEKGTYELRRTLLHWIKHIVLLPLTFGLGNLLLMWNAGKDKSKLEKFIYLYL